jgi:hypothetical protein
MRETISERVVSRSRYPSVHGSGGYAYTVPTMLVEPEECSEQEREGSLCELQVRWGCLVLSSLWVCWWGLL